MPRVPLALVVLCSALACGVLALGACRSATPVTDLRIQSAPPSSGGGNLAGMSWTLREITLPDGSTRRDENATIRFEAGGRVGVRSCNSCGGAYVVSGSTVTFSQLACTRMACVPERLELERHLDGALTFARRGDLLVLQLAGGGAATFAPGPAGD